MALGRGAPQAGGLAIGLTTYTTLQLWPPLGAWFSAIAHSHVATGVTTEIADNVRGYHAMRIARN